MGGEARGQGGVASPILEGVGGEARGQGGAPHPAWKGREEKPAPKETRDQLNASSSLLFVFGIYF